MDFYILDVVSDWKTTFVVYKITDIWT